MVISGVSVVVSVASLAGGGFGAAASSAARMATKAAAQVSSSAKAAKLSARAKKFEKLAATLEQAKKLGSKKTDPMMKAFDEKAKTDLAATLKTDLDAAAGSNEDLTEVASQSIDDRVAQEFGRATNSYKAIVKEASKSILEKEIEDMNLEFLKGVVSFYDPTGLLGAVNDFKKPKCPDILPKTDLFCPACKFA